MIIQYPLRPHPATSDNQFVVQVCEGVNSAFAKLNPQIQELISTVEIDFLGNCIEVIIRMKENLTTFTGKHEARFTVAQSGPKSVQEFVESNFIKFSYKIISWHAIDLREHATRLENLVKE
jgi:hypothetical protein